jgi:hypothetical protein
MCDYMSVWVLTEKEAFGISEYLLQNFKLGLCQMAFEKTNRCS